MPLSVDVFEGSVASPAQGDTVLACHYCWGCQTPEAWCLKQLHLKMCIVDPLLDPY